MDFSLPDEYQALRGVVREFAEAEIAPHAEEWDAQRRFPVEMLHRLGEIGMFGLNMPEEHGGTGRDLLALCVAVEELARVDSSIALTVEAAVGLGAAPIDRFGTDEQKARWLPDLVAGRGLAAFGLTESDAGSDAAALHTRAILDGDEWVIDGTKAFITNSGTEITSLITVAARTGEGEISTIIVPSGTDGLTVEPPYRKMGWRASDTHGLVLEGCRVPADHLLGERGRGLRQFLEILDEGRVAIAALSVGLAQGCLEHSLAHATERTAFGRPIGAYQAMAFKIADMQVAVDAARLLTHRAALLRDSGLPFRTEAAIAKLFASEAAVDATRHATQIFGGAGFMDETPVSRFYRDAKVLEIGEGTSEIQRLVISRALGLPV